VRIDQVKGKKTMKKTAYVIAGLLLGAGLSAPALAQIDAGALTCEAFLALDAGGKVEASNAVSSYVADAANAATTAAAAEMMKGMDATQAQQAIESACNGAAAGTTVPMALQTK
jgi:hypothetical protein